MVTQFHTITLKGISGATQIHPSGRRKLSGRVSTFNISQYRYHFRHFLSGFQPLLLRFQMITKDWLWSNVKC